MSEFEIDPPIDRLESADRTSSGQDQDDAPLEAPALVPPADWGEEEGMPEASDLPVAAQDDPEAPFTIIEIGSGRSPIITSPDAPDVARFYQEGGKYTGIDARADNLRSGAEITDLYRQAYTRPGATVEIDFEQASIEDGEPLPVALQPDSADRVVVSNVLTDPRIARYPDVCRAIAQTAMDLVRKEPPGEVVMIGTIEPKVYPRQAVQELLGAIGLEYIGSDDIAPYVVGDYRSRQYDLMYADRYRPAAHQESKQASRRSGRP